VEVYHCRAAVLDMDHSWLAYLEYIIFRDYENKKNAEKISDCGKTQWQEGS
jgi:hypothetical protein